jgi:hypothetical protein
MLTGSVFTCPFCKKIGNQTVLFLGSEFSYQCPHCRAVHCFLENPHWDFTENFRSFSGWAGSTNLVDWKLDQRPNKVRSFQVTTDLKNAFDVLLDNTPAENPRNLTIQKLSSKDSSQKTIFFANASPNPHFQECFRALVQMQSHLLNPFSKTTYNILLLNSNLKFLDTRKLVGLDEVWTIEDYSQKDHVWYVKDNLKDNVHARSLAYAINNAIRSFNNFGFVISKKAGPTPFGTSLIHNILQKDNITIRTNLGREVAEKYLAVLVRPDTEQRAGFFSTDQIREIYDFAIRNKKTPLLVACTPTEKSQCLNLGLEFVFLKDMAEQSYFFKHFCLGVICGHGSCCNIPCLHEIPVLAFAKDRFFPDDFYCFGRLTCAYNPKHLFYGDLYKPQNVVELRVSKGETRITNHLNEAQKWIDTFVT